jgi:hypothetical protein
MPKLPTFTAELGSAPVSGGRRAVAPDLDTGAGKAITKAANTFLDDTEERESREALIASSEIRAKYARELDAAALDGRDTEKLKEQLQGDLAKVGDNFQTLRGHQSLALYTSNTELMFDEQANKIRVQRAGAEARLQGSKFLTSAGAIIQSNPTYLGTAVREVDDFVATLKNVSPEARAEIANGLKGELNMSAAISSARIDPEGTKKRLDAGEWQLTPEQRATAMNKADTEIRAKRADEAYQRATREYEERERDDKARDKHFAGIIGGTATRRQIMDDADLRPQTREHLITFMEQRAKERLTGEKKSDEAVKRALWLRIHAPDSDPKKIFNGDAIFAAVQAGHLNTTDANSLNALVAGQKDENNRTIGSRLYALSGNVSRSITQDPRFTGQPELVAEILNDYSARVLEKIATLRKENKDPSVVFDPNSKEYVGSAEYVKASVDGAKSRRAALLPKHPDLREKPDAWRDVGVGDTFIDPKGQPRVMTQALKDALAKQAPAAALPASAPTEGSMSNVAAP